MFLNSHGVGWYRRQGIEIRATRSAPLLALTVNPVAPRSHSFESRALREGLERVLGEVPVLDVCAPDYSGATVPPPSPERPYAPAPIEVRIYVCGARGSTPAPGAEFARYGGHTCCLALVAEGEVISL